MPHRVVIVGSGFGGLQAARNLGEAPVDVTVLDRHNYHLFQPLLYQVATGGLSPGDIAAPLRAVLRKQKNTEVLLGEAVDIDVAGRRVILSDGEQEYDTLVLATGSEPSYFGHSDWERLAPPLKSVEDATEIRRRMLVAFEAAEREPDAARRRAWLTFVIVGGGPTGVELAGAFAEIARDTLRGHFRLIDPRESQIFLVEHAPMVLPQYPPDLSAHAECDLVRLGVRSLLGTSVTGVDAEGVTLERDHKSDRILTRTVIWAAGVRSSGLARILAERTGARLDRGGRLLVAPDLTVPGHPEIFVAGDLAHVEQDGKPLPGLAPVAMQQGRYVAHVISRRASGQPAPPPFHYRDKGSLATIGRAKAVGEIWGVHVGGWFAWVTWLFVHLAYLIGFQNRLLVLIQWGFSYFTFNRRARLITGPSPLPFGREHESVRTAGGSGGEGAA
ncbi:MAG TPA: NAD(P)/FAD-dependent oxidoreductase [Bryobacteraceae bacterium]